MNRTLFIDIAKSIAIIAIVDVHIIGGGTINIGETFHVAFFLFLPGLFLHKDNSLVVGYKDFIIKKAKSLLWPFFTLSIINAIITLIISYITSSPNYSAIVSAIVLRGYGTLWFLPVLFLGELISGGLYKIAGGNKILLSTSFIIIILILYICKATFLDASFLAIDYSRFNITLIRWPIVFVLSGLIAASFSLLAAIFSETILKFELYSKKSSLIILLILVLSLCINYASHNYYNCDLHYLKVFPLAVYYLASVSGISVVLSLSMLLSYIPGRLRFLSALGEGRNTLVIMTTHKELFICWVAYKLSSNLPIISSNIQLVHLFSLIVTILFEIPIVKIANATKIQYLFKYPFS